MSVGTQSRRIAVVLGSNGPERPDQLKFALSDCQKMAAALKQYCDFSVRRIAGRDASTVLTRLQEAAGSCRAEDDFLAYFSGHGELNWGDLFLLLDKTQENLLGSSLRASWVMDVLKQTSAQNKMLILDCCHAGAASGLKGDVELASIVPPGPSLLVLCASDRLERARELDALKGSFLTHEICNILSTRTHLPVTVLARELQQRARNHNKKEPKARVPVPFLIGELRNDFMLRGRGPGPEALADQPVSEEVSRKLAAAAAPLASISLKLTVEHVPAKLIKVLKRKPAATKDILNRDPFKDLNEHHEVDDEGEERYVQLAVRHTLIQPLINLLATDSLRERYGVLAVGFGRHCTALLCIGWVDKAELFETRGNFSTMPSGVLIGDEIDFSPAGLSPQERYKRKKTNAPKTGFEISGDSLALTLELDHRSLNDAFIRYTRSRLSASLPEEILLFAWVPSEKGDRQADSLPFDSKKLHESVLELRSSQDASEKEKRPDWLRHLHLEIVPNNAKFIGKSYDLTFSGGGDLIEGPRADDEVGFVQVWRGQPILAKAVASNAGTLPADASGDTSPPAPATKAEVF